jgi:PAS domain-containing protein
LVKDHAANDEEAVMKDKPFSQQIKTVRRSLHALRRRLTAKAGGRVPRVEPAAGLDEVGKTLDAAALEFSHLRAELAAARAEILEKGRAEETLAAERNLLRTLIDSLPDRIYIKDVESRFLLNNIAHLQALGARFQEEVAGKTDYDYRPPDLADRRADGACIR